MDMRQGFPLAGTIESHLGEFEVMALSLRGKGEGASSAILRFGSRDEGLREALATSPQTSFRGYLRTGGENLAHYCTATVRVLRMGRMNALSALMLGGPGGEVIHCADLPDSEWFCRAELSGVRTVPGRPSLTLECEWS